MKNLIYILPKIKSLKFYYLSVLLLYGLISFSQDMSIQWQRTFGTVYHDYFTDGVQTADGGFIFSGYNGNYWVVKTDSSGIMEWEKSVVGNNTDILTSIRQTMDGGFILGGYSTSGAENDKSEANKGFEDYWVVKLSATGEIEWENSIGGPLKDYLWSVGQSTDGGYLLGGYSESGISADKTEDSHLFDIWVVKLDNAGTVVWQNTIMGNMQDYLRSLETTPDGGCVLVSTSTSGAAFDKTEPSYGSDIWVVKLDALGNILWQNTLNAGDNGEAAVIKQTTDGGYIVGGYSGSGTSADKTENGMGGNDYWVVKLNSAGVRTWDNTIGGSNNDFLTDINQTSEGGYFVGGYSVSGISGDKSEPYVQAIDIFDINNDYWTLKLNAAGNVKWQNTIGGGDDDKLIVSFQTTDAGFLLGGHSASGISGDKTEAAISGYDFWIVKMVPGPCNLFTEICNGFDDNCNLLTDDADPVITGQPTWYADADADTYGDPLISSTACVSPAGMVNNNVDCNDSNSAIHPFVAEIYNAMDDNCDGLTDNVPPEMVLQNTIGGISSDVIKVLKRTTDGGYILGGKSSSDISIDKNEESVGTDYWVVKIDAGLNIEWQNTISGDDLDELTCIALTSDGGYIVGGYSNSGIGYDKTEDQKGMLNLEDYWIVKLNSSGFIEWDQTIGGSGADFLNAIDQTSDGGYILGGTSSSGAGYDKTEGVMGSSDFWVVKTNASGGIQWQNTIGGNSSDGLYSIKQVAGGGYILGGYSQSGVSGDKTEASYGSNDYWAVCLNPTGSIVWQKTLGGSESDIPAEIIQSSDGGFLIGGNSLSSISGNKTENSQGDDDYWVIKLSSVGEIIWQNTIGGSGIDQLYGVTEASDGGYLLAGNSTSGISGDKTDPFLSDGNFDYWPMKLTSSGLIEWQKTIGGSLGDNLRSIEETLDGGFVLGGYSNSQISGDKNEAASNFDYWVVTLMPTCIPVSELCNVLDDNCNGLIDDGVVETISISAGGATTFCQGGSTLLTASYSGASVQWKKNGSNIPGATSSTYSVNKSGNYSAVTTSPCGNATSSTINVTVNKNPAASISAAGATSFCAGGSVTLTEIPVAGSTYQWYKGASLIAGATSTNYIATTAGNYRCRVTKTATGCYKNSNAISVTVPCKEGDESINEENLFSIYPNPNNGTFTISAFSASLQALRETENTKLEIYNSLGQLIYSQQINSFENNFTQTISLNNISSGIYFVRVGDGNNYAEQELIIEK